MTRLFDWRVLLLPTLLLIAALFLPWVGVRPNRIALPEFHTLPFSMQLLGGGVVLLLLLPAFWKPRLLWVGVNLALLGGVVLLGGQTVGQMVSQPEIARASASSGFWLWMLGSGMVFLGTLTVPEGWQKILWWLWLPGMLLFAALHGLDSWSVLIEGKNEGERFALEFLQHLKLTFTALGFGLLIAGPLAVWGNRSARTAQISLQIAGALQTLPSLALLGLLIAPLSALSQKWPFLQELGIRGIGTAPALVALTLYALLPILRNGIVALQTVDPDTLDAAKGMGMTARQVFWKVQLPLALPVWLAGVRQASVLLIGITSIAALIGAGGLGTYIFKGLQGGASDLILLGALPAMGLALLLDGLFKLLERQLTPQGTHHD
ncbi:ABC transporter permease [Deinococcus misasensis]|uniref:ABC transporter permease n=1 Tax=Deinococcus misasensis TaxID=392413 RepID=UPI000551E734|nr:ABC transporter permease [Deinococcus misasensis]